MSDNLIDNLFKIEDEDGNDERTVLKEYLEKITDDSTTTANFTPKQVRGLIRLMVYDKLYFEPICSRTGFSNIPRKLTQGIVELSKGKEGWGADKLVEVFRRERELEEREKDREVYEKNMRMDRR